MVDVGLATYPAGITAGCSNGLHGRHRHSLHASNFEALIPAAEPAKSTWFTRRRRVYIVMHYLSAVELLYGVDRKLASQRYTDRHTFEYRPG